MGCPCLKRYSTVCATSACLFHCWLSPCATQGDGPGANGGIGAAISGGLNRKLSGAFSRRSSHDVAFHGGDVQLARQVSSLPLLAYREGEGYVNSSPEQEIDGHIDEVPALITHIFFVHVLRSLTSFHASAAQFLNFCSISDEVALYLIYDASAAGRHFSCWHRENALPLCSEFYHCCRSQE
jgi:hypothetical protein